MPRRGLWFPPLKRAPDGFVDGSAATWPEPGSLSRYHVGLPVTSATGRPKHIHAHVHEEQQL